MRVYLIGFMGSGKSTLGRVLAQKLGYEHIDLDRCVEAYALATIPEIFARDGGEAQFRSYESQCLQVCTAENDNVVISTGGGTPCFGGNMDLMCGSGLTIYLKLEPKMLAARLAVSKTKRPLLAGKNEEQIEQFIIESLAAREVYYNRSSIIFANPSRDVSRLYELVKYEIERKIY